ncbi:hypothetical protein A8C32_16480 [Flavivirga aquatica]|uniref:Outer membrane lipoprotein-sorting protein n=1 Tax=Flavivirga aquatica TaxID=1849968 RepID=A0A1E5T9I6_9FLAO|nr:hypothetical protein [Flavivirga aquatica]OEK08050.1 hypothetical protein A8C32_16480 [Flavivirga aquatica]
MKGYIIALQFLILLGHSIYAQTASHVFEQANSEMTKFNILKLPVRYGLYRGVKGKEELDTYTGYTIRKKDGQVYQKIHKSETVMGADFMVKVDNEEKVMLYNDSPVKSEGIKQFDLSLLTPFFKLPEFGKSLSTMQYIVILKAKEGYTDLPYSRIDLHINKENFYIEKQVFYTIGLVDFSEDPLKPDLDIYRIEIEYDDYINMQSVKEVEELFKASRYVKAIGSQYRPSLKYNQYEFIAN